jgi:hypothetical protein
MDIITDNNTLATNSETQDTVNFVRKASFKDNNKKLVCRATHRALDEPKVTEKTLQILCKFTKADTQLRINHFVSSVKPQPINQFDEVIQQFGFLEGRYGIIAVDVFANPEPRFQWKINGEYPDRARYTPVNNQIIVQNEV